MTYLSLIIPTKNEERQLPRLLASIGRQTFKDYEVIVADNGSTDRTREIATLFGARVVDGGLPGPGRNRGAAVAQGEIIFFVDADAVLSTPTFLADCLNEFDLRQLDVATCILNPMSRRSLDRAFHRVYNSFVLTMEHVRAHAAGSCIIARRTVHEQIGGFDECVLFAEDMEYVQRASKLQFEFGILRTQPIAVSVRRLERDGHLNMACRLIFTELRILTLGYYRDKMPFKYEMGG